MSEYTQFNWKKREYHLVGEREKAINDGLFPLGMIIIFICSISGINLAAKDKLFLQIKEYKHLDRLPKDRRFFSKSQKIVK